MPNNDAPPTVQAINRTYDSYDFAHELGADFAGSRIIAVAGAADRTTINLDDGRELVYELDLTDRLWRLTKNLP